ncbi:MAG: Nif3-like dinuclear metal center hexameric protein [Gemmatimonadota bacterium]
MKGRLPLRDLVAHLDAYLDLANVPDFPGARNGLQVENAGTVSRIAACTDACQATIDAAAERGADFLLVHHGLFWGDGIQPLTDRSYRRVRTLLEAGIAVYSAHLPLDVHPEVGNNARLARLLGMDVAGHFGEYEGCAIGVHGELDIARDDLARRLAKALGREPTVIATGPERCRRVGIVTGGASSLIARARDASLDTFVSGEGPHHSYFDAEEWGLNVLYAGHYATETLGVKALAEHLGATFGLPWEFIDHPTGL